MMNTIETYMDAGHRAGKASAQGDEVLAASWHDWKNRALLLENEADRPAASEAYRNGYRNGWDWNRPPAPSI